MSNKYFNNATLNDFWDRLVTAVANLDQKALEPGAYTDTTFTNLVYTWDELLERGDYNNNGGIQPYENEPCAELAGYYYVYGQNYAFVIPDTITTGVGTEGCKALVFPSTTTEFQTGMEGTIDTIYIKATTPPTLPWEDYFYDCNHNGSNDGYVNIVVPMGCGDAYKTADIWSTYADYITEGEMPGGSSADSWGPVTFDGSNMQGYVSLNTTYNVLETLDAVAYTIYNSEGNAVKHGCGFYDPSILDSGVTPLTDLPNGNYIVRIIDSGTSGMSSLVGLEGTLTIGTVEGTAKWAHNVLMKHAKLTRATTPVTPADYMKGIAVCARYLNNIPDYIYGADNLETIVINLEQAISGPGVEEITVSFSQSERPDTSDILLMIITSLDQGISFNCNIKIEDETDGIGRVVAVADRSGSASRLNVSLMDIYPNFVLDSYYHITVTVTAENARGEGEVYISWPFDNPGSGGFDFASAPDATMNQDGYIYINNYASSDYNNCQAIIESRYYHTDGSYDSTTDWFTLYDGEVSGFQGEAYNSDTEYWLYLRDPDDELNHSETVRVVKPY